MTLMTRRTVRFGLALVATAALGLLTAVPANAATSYALYLGFPDSDPKQADVGPTPGLHGLVRGVAPDSVDFYGRSVVRVADRAALDPESGDFEFAARVRLTRGAGNWNIMQKGYWSDPGQWKLSLHSTTKGLKLSCRIKGTAGAVHVYSSPGVISVGGGWVTAGCRRVGDRVSVVVDGREVGAATGRTGTVRSSKEVLVGSKGMTASDPDQFLGLLDDVWVKS